MKFKSEKGVTGIDITLSVILITIFIGLLTTLSLNIEQKSKQVDRHAEALYYAVNSIEEVKKMDFETLPKTTDLNNNKISLLADGYLKNEKGQETPYYRTTNVIDYSQMPENQGKNSIPDIAKKINVKISYRVKEENKEINLSVVKVKE